MKKSQPDAELIVLCLKGMDLVMKEAKAFNAWTDAECTAEDKYPPRPVLPNGFYYCKNNSSAVLRDALREHAKNSSATCEWRKNMRDLYKITLAWEKECRAIDVAHKVPRLEALRKRYYDLLLNVRDRVTEMRARSTDAMNHKAAFIEALTIGAFETDDIVMSLLFDARTIGQSDMHLSNRLGPVVLVHGMPARNEMQPIAGNAEPMLMAAE